MPGFVPSYGEGTMGELVLQVLRDAGDGGLTVTEPVSYTHLTLPTILLV